ncbi:uncharacterized protein LOC119688965 [Teleopsis dalmanni]|uniref:uncharacterized protein LOC119688965 n=1 Tax=Teleopsis dalmanni TaxID=139649 RepID=UPI0018CE0D31|nr:uncharacterized protein LOC119688965 [Teleopsis dalmanni]
MKLLILLCLIGVCVSKPASKESDSVNGMPNFPKCSATDSNINECMKSLFQQMVPLTKNGIKELNIPPLDPFVIEKSNYQYSNGAVQGRITVRNVRVHGMSNAVVENVDFRLNGDKLDVDFIAKVPNMAVEGTYKAEMKINDVKMTPKGVFNVSMTDITIKSHPSGELYERDGHTYLRLTSFDSQPEVGDMHIYATGLVPDPNLNTLLLDYVNQYWRPIYTAMLPETRSTWEPFMLQTANDILSKTPFDMFVTKKK